MENISKSSNDKISSIPEEEGSNKQQLESETKASDFSLKKNTSKSSVKSSKPARSTSSIQNQELKITESIDYYGNSSKDEAPADAPDDRQLINNESASSQSPIIDVVRSLDNLEPLSLTAESVENVTTHEKSINTASKISFQEIIAQTSTDDLVRVLSQVSKKTSRADIMEKLASATNLAASNDDNKSSISAPESFGRKSSSIPAHDKTFLEGGSISSNKSNQDQDRKSRSSKASRPISQARSAASSTRSAVLEEPVSITDSLVLSQNREDEKLSTKSGSSKISRASMPVSQTRSASSRSLEEAVKQNDSAVLPQNSEDEKLSTKSESSKASLDRILRKSSGRSSVASEMKIADNLADDKSTKSSRMSEEFSEEENVPKKLLCELLNAIESGDEKEDKSFSETDEAKEREDLKEPSTSQRRITRGKLRSFISEKSLKSVRSGSQASIAAGKSIDEKHYISRTSSVKSTEDVIRSSNSVANSVLNDILKVTKEDLIANEDTGEIPQETMLSGSNNSLAEKKRSEKDHAFKVPPTPKPSRASMNDQSGRDK